MGTQKGGTTALNAYLARIPGICTAAVKEIHYFDNEDLDWSNPDYSLLHAHYDWEGNVVRGEATPIYMYWPQSIERIYKYNPDIKIIICLRNPVYRAYSHWKMEYSRNSEYLSFKEAVSDIGRSRVRNSKGAVHRVYSYIERGFYKYQIERILKFFPKNKCLFIKIDDLWNNTTVTINSVCEFLEVNNNNKFNAEYIIPINTKKLDEIDRDLYKSLLSMYIDNIVGTGNLTGLDLSNWLNVNYFEPMMQG